MGVLISALLYNTISLIKISTARSDSVNAFHWWVWYPVKSRYLWTCQKQYTWSEKHIWVWRGWHMPSLCGSWVSSLFGRSCFQLRAQISHNRWSFLQSPHSQLRRRYDVKQKLCSQVRQFFLSLPLSQFGDRSENLARVCAGRGGWVGLCGGIRMPGGSHSLMGEGEGRGGRHTYILSAHWMNEWLCR